MATRRRRKKKRPPTPFTGAETVSSAVDPVLAIEAGKLVLIESAEKPKWLKFACPCRCGEVVALNLMASHYPSWTVETGTGGTLDVSPSVWSRTCGSHYWIVRSRAVWV